MPTRKPFPSRQAALESLENLCALATHGIQKLEAKYRIDAPSVRKQVAETRRGLAAVVRAWDRGGR
jgi:hypothetical protein